MKIFIKIVFLILLTNSVCFGEDGRYNLNSYGQQSWNSDVEDGEYGTRNFWSHYYWNFTRNQNCAITPLCENTHTHTGIDYNLGTRGASGNVKSYGYGKIIAGGTDNYHTVSIQNLLTSGELVIFNLLHMVNISDNVEEDYYLTKNQRLGDEGNFTGGIARTTGQHLHLDVSNLSGSAIIRSDNAYPCPGENNDCLDRLCNNETSLFKDQLIPHYSMNNCNKIFYDPVEVANEYSELLPYLSIESNPSVNNYSVFGYENIPLYGALFLHRQHTQIFDEIGIKVYRSSLNNFNRYHLTDINNMIAMSENQSVTDNTMIVGSSTYNRNSYAFFPRVNKDTNNNDTNIIVEGYPVLFDVLPENELIVDNDQCNRQPGKDIEQTDFVKRYRENRENLTVPGYYLSANLIKSNTNNVTEWHPNRKGKFQIWVYIPIRGGTATNVHYKIFFNYKDSNRFCITAPIDHTIEGWQQLSCSYIADNNTTIVFDTFYFGSDDFVQLDPMIIENRSGNNDSLFAVDAIKFIGGTTSDFEKIRTNLSVNENVAKKIYRNFMTENPNSINGISVVHNDDESIYTNGTRVVSLKNVEGLFLDYSENLYYSEAVIELQKKNFIKGYDPQPFFKPSNKISRTEFLSILNNVAATDNCYKSNNCEEPAFLSGISDKIWQYREFMISYNKGWISKYRPDDAINRAEVAMVLTLAKGFAQKNNDDPNTLTLQKDIETYFDEDDVYTGEHFSDISNDENNAWYYKSIYICKEKNIFNGYPDNTFQPKKNINRAEATTVIYKAFKNLLK